MSLPPPENNITSQEQYAPEPVDPGKTLPYRSWDVMLFSGGGNDIVDNPMALWVRDFDPAVPPAALIHQQRFERSAGAGARRLRGPDRASRRLSPTTHLVLHGYDFAIPDGRGVCGFGPWLEPTFDLRGFPAALPSRQPVIDAMLAQFATMLTSLAGAGRHVHQRPGNAAAAGQLLAQRTASDACRLRQVRRTLP